MKTVADLCVVPMGVGVSVAQYITRCQEILQEFDVDTNMHGYGTNIEGCWDEVFAAIKRCHEEIHQMGAERISTTIKVGTRTDREQNLQDKIETVSSKLESTNVENAENASNGAGECPLTK